MSRFGCNREDHPRIGRRELLRVGSLSLFGTSLADLLRLAARADRFGVVRTMHHVADRQFRNEHNTCAYLLHSGTTALPAGDTNASIVQPRPGRIAWPSIGSLVAYAAPPDPGVG